MGDGDVRRVHDILQQDGVVVGELMDGGEVLEAFLGVVLEPRQLLCVGACLLPAHTQITSCDIFTTYVLAHACFGILAPGTS